MESNKDINIQVIEKLTKLQKDQRLASDNTMNEIKKILCEIYHCDDNENPILINGELPNPSRIGQLEIAVNELRSRERSNFSRRGNIRRVVATTRRRRGGRRTRGKLRAKSRDKSRKKRRKSRRRMRGKSKGRKRRKKRR